MPIVVPTLSSSGWVRSPSEKADYLLAHFFEADKFQTHLYGENVSSLSWIIQEKRSIPDVVALVRSTLEDYLGRYFDQALVDVKSDDDPKVNPTSKISLTVYASVTEQGREYSLARLVEAIDGKFKKVIALNNGPT